MTPQIDSPRLTIIPLDPRLMRLRLDHYEKLQVALGVEPLSEPHYGDVDYDKRVHESLQAVTEHLVADAGNDAQDAAVPGIGNKRFSNFSAQLRSDRNVLHVRIGTRKPTRGRSNLIEARVHPRRFGVYEQRKGIDVSRLEFAQFTKFHYSVSDLVDPVVQLSGL